MPRARHPLGILPGNGTRAPEEIDGARAGAARAPGAVERWLARRIAGAGGRPPVELALWDGSVVHRPRDGSPHGRITWRDRGALWAVARSPELGFGDMYSAGRITVDGDLAGVLEQCFRAALAAGAGGLKRGLLGRAPRAAPNGRRRAREHAGHHYDLGNDFYALWLDRDLVYTCAYYARPGLDLEAAQRAKLAHVARKLRLAPGQRVVEAGSGWGALALHLARHHGVHVTAYNVSREQVAFARERARRQGLDARVVFVEDDYRAIRGAFDAFVSVGMLEHVGPAHYRALGAVIDRVLEPHGLALVHSVGRAAPGPPNAWLERRIFPGSHPPSLGEMMAVCEPFRFQVLDVENLRLHYARTLRDWLARFDAHRDTVRARYGETFVRAWRLYLAGCAASFAASATQLYQVVLARPGHDRLPRTRSHLYAGAGAGHDVPCWPPGAAPDA